jgi:transcriptional regulator with XRE-family HTH domain
MQYQTFGQFLIKARTDRQLSQEALALSLPVSQTTLSRWEADTRLPSVVETIQLAQLLSCEFVAICQIIYQSSLKNKPKKQKLKIIWGGGKIQLNKNRLIPFPLKRLYF